MLMDYRGEQVVIIGLGLTGLSCVEFFRRRGVTPRVMDTRFAPPGLEKLPSDVPRHLGSLHKQWLLDATLIVTSPGVPLSHPALAAVAGVAIIGDIELFAREASAPVVAITGSNGKSTVTHMVSEIATTAGWQIGLGGNIGFPALTLLDSLCQLYILELSSFQLETTHSLKTAAATVLNISEDHINRYPLGLQQYRAAKLKIYHNAEVCVVNSEDSLTLPVRGYDSRCISFGVERGDYYLRQHAGQIWLMAHGEPVMKSSELRFGGRHNYTNSLAALALADALGIPSAASLTALRQFRGLAHRFELVHERRGVRWINDSKSTNVGSTGAALNGLEVTGTLYLLLGGDGKSADFTPLIPWLKGDQVKLYCFGQDGAKLASLHPEAAMLTETLEQAMRIIGSQVSAGDLVLLSPACASLDQFSNFEVRGDVFTRLAREVG
ncbi:UDP-N-acetylmuramoyl-L-alanine--D-glutamate ligase [Candidatus Doolittlea endobia]|uniref:UDP-N-acetylmuramoylalanine--D-glutamate ligase n=1 Tax=Candidatus Doolittlea endobia TaxID=1778262 RepID=A0A143WUC2_9ENTR|nr:UDP-N-acetylmuramoyl-L-alanine--D-glutamate ligase [Candidatus Doolittlea endobia]CUX96459.1 UDP-N-acetylmuramoylalanine--D-glutamate ligase [Candidatus Doolittlea endobia]